MGCGNSKLNLKEGEPLPAPIRPLLRSRFLELRKRKNGSNLRDGTLSKKVLLKNRELEEDNSMLVDNTKSVSSSSPNGSPNSLAAKDTKQDMDEDSPIPLSNNAANQSNQHLEHPQPHKHLKTTYPPDDELQHNDTSVELNDMNKDDEETYEDEGGENNKTGEEFRLDNEENRCIICPGSPSFRVYFVEETKNDKVNVETKDADKEDVSHKKSPSHDSVESTTSANFGEGQENKMMKKGKKGRSFKRVISKRRPVGVKNLLNVKSCYHIGCSGNDRASLLARKEEA